MDKLLTKYDVYHERLGKITQLYIWVLGVE
jgi:hypothetical protein